MKPKMVKVFKQGSSLAMVIPAEIASELRLVPGEVLSVSLRGGRILVDRMFPPTPSDLESEPSARASRVLVSKVSQD